MSDLTLLEVAQIAIEDPLPVDADDTFSRHYTCRRCNGDFHVEVPLDPCPLCHDCAHDVARELGIAIVRIYDHLKTLPVIVAAPIKLAIEKPSGELGQALIDEVLDATARHVTKRRARRKR